MKNSINNDSYSQIPNETLNNKPQISPTKNFKTKYVLKRPHVDEFLKELSNIFEIITFTASLSQYADPLLDSLDKFHVVSHRLFRENCINQKGMYIKDLRKIGTDLKNIILIDNNPISYIMNIDNGLPILTWYESLKDNELMKLIPLLKYLANVEDVRTIIKKVVNRKSNTIDFNIVNQIIKGNNDNILNNNYNESANKNKAINYSMIAKKITNSLSNMTYSEYIKNLKKKNSNSIRNVKKQLCENNKINNKNGEEITNIIIKNEKEKNKNIENKSASNNGVNSSLTDIGSDKNHTIKNKNSI